LGNGDVSRSAHQDDEDLVPLRLPIDPDACGERIDAQRDEIGEAGARPIDVDWAAAWPRARQIDGARADLASASLALGKYFDPSSRKTQVAAGVLQQVQAQMKSVELPRMDETLAALATAAAGR